MTIPESIQNNALVIEHFIMNYMMDTGIQVQFFENLLKNLTGQNASAEDLSSLDGFQTVAMLQEKVLSDVINSGGPFGSPSFDLERVVDGAVSFEFLVRHARTMDESIMPRSVVPPQRLVAEMLRCFHGRKAAALVNA